MSDSLLNSAKTRTIPSDRWDEVFKLLHTERATQLFVAPPGIPWRESWSQDFDEMGYFFWGRFPNHGMAKLPESVTRLGLVGQHLDQAGALSIARELKQLTSLNVSNNSIGDPGARAIAQELKQLASLNISGNGIGDPGALYIAQDLKRLTSLDISASSIRKNGARIIAQELKQLTSLNISKNGIGDPGARAIAQELKQLTSLNISSNGIGESGARNIARQLKQLNSLSISDNAIGENGAWAIAQELKQLATLSVWGNRIGATGARAVAQELKQLTSLNITDNSIGETGAKDIARELKQLTSLYISKNGIGERGACAVALDLKQLTLLYISGNRVGVIGARAIAQELNQLTSLNISNNRVGVSGARAIAQALKQLTSLYISVNRVGESGARAIAQELKQLTYLDISNNGIRDTGARAIAQGLKQLTYLDISKNGIGDSGVRAIAQDLKQLTSLNVTRNDSITDLSPFANRIRDGWPVNDSRTVGVSVHGCNLVTPPLEIVRRGPEAVRNYFQELVSGTDKLYEAKVLILGEGGAGKTSLLRRLFKPDMPLPQVDETTRGIDIHRHDFECESDRRFRLNVWDFGGQQIYHATHQFFLTKNSLYVLVDDTKKDDKSVQDESFKYWLEVVETLSRKSPVLIFQNEKGGRSKSIDEPGIKARFPNVQIVCRANLEKKESAQQLAAEIRHHVQKLPHVGETVPSKWVTIRHTLEERSKSDPFISLDDYLQIYGEHLELDRTKAMHLSQYLHDLGVFLHFQDDMLLRRTVILQNRWATEAVFKILDDESIKERHGQFTEGDCERLWQHSEYVDMHPELLALMERFELCYRLRDQLEPKWLSPQLLPPSIPSRLEEWSDPSDLVLNYSYEFMPKGLVNRLMVRMHRFVKNIDLCWSYGAFFEHYETSVLVHRDAKGSQILLRARGPQRGELLSIISSDLDALNAKFEGLKVDKLIPCPCSECEASETRHMFSEADLQKRKANGRMEAECFNSYELVSVMQLLDGLKIESLPAWATEEPDRTIRIFLASSEEIRNQRDAFDLFLKTQNDRLRNDGIYLQVLRWETEVASMSKARKQDDYNERVRECDIFVALFKTKTGCFTEEEFDVALEAMRAGSRPFIYTYFQDVQINIDDADNPDVKSRRKFQEKLKQLGHYWSIYKDISDLKNMFREQLDKLLDEGRI